MEYHAGLLDQRIELQAKTRVPDGVGGASTTWATYATVWAMVRPMTGRERETAMRSEGRAGYKVVVRNRDDIAETHRILWRGRYMNIRFPVNAGPRGLWLELEAELGASS
jgi:SPP1 family predicted phage head-tail adaptor